MNTVSAERRRRDGDMMNRAMMMTVLSVVLSAFCLPGCREQIEARPPSLQGDELIIAPALRQHMNDHFEQTGYDYTYIFLTVLGKDPSMQFMNYFDDLFPQVLPGSKMQASSYGYEDLPQTPGIWVHFEAVSIEHVSEQEARVTCRTFEYQREDRAVKYRMQLIDGQWKATDIVGVGEEKILQ
jgi:hypothetical protein